MIEFSQFFLLGFGLFILLIAELGVIRALFSSKFQIMDFNKTKPKAVGYFGFFYCVLGLGLINFSLILKLFVNFNASELFVWGMLFLLCGLAFIYTSRLSARLAEGESTLFFGGRKNVEEKA